MKFGPMLLVLVFCCSSLRVFGDDHESILRPLDLDWKAGVPHPDAKNFPHLVSSEKLNGWIPEPGYVWAQIPTIENHQVRRKAPEEDKGLSHAPPLIGVTLFLISNQDKFSRLVDESRAATIQIGRQVYQTFNERSEGSGPQIKEYYGPAFGPKDNGGGKEYYGPGLGPRGEHYSEGGGRETFGPAF